jgi:hypothetical protein
MRMRFLLLLCLTPALCGAAAVPDSDPGLTGAERQQVKTLQQELLDLRTSGEMDKTEQADRLRVR